MSETVRQETFTDAGGEEVQAVLDWLRTAPDLSSPLLFEHLPGKTSLDLQVGTGRRVEERFLDGGRRVRLPLELRYRCAPTDDGERLEAGAALERLVRWAEADIAGPDLGQERRFERFEATGQVTLEARFESGYEDRLIPCELIWHEAPIRGIL